MVIETAFPDTLIKRGNPLPPATVTIRVCEPTDIDRLSRKHWSEFHDHEPQFNWQYLRAATCIQPFAGDLAVGYLFMYILPQPYDPDLMGVVDLYYLDPAYRSEGVGRRMFQLAEDMARVKGAKKMTASYNLKHPHPEFFKGMGYERTHAVLAKGI
jgi:GNAT superfamily N-acetyltransferase